MAGISLTGLASGLDTETIISQLMALEARPKAALQVSQLRLEGRVTALQDVGRQLRALGNAVRDLKSVLTWGDVQKVTSSDESKVAARQLGPAPVGNITVEVMQLARAEQRTYDWAATPGFTINGVAVDTSAATTVEEAAAAINGTSGIGVFAGVVNGQLVLTHKQLGQAISVTGGSAPAEDTTKRVLAQQTEYKINGVLQDPTTSSVVEPGGLPGIELTLKNVTDGPVTLSITPPGPDADKVKDKVKAFVEAYNSAIDLVRSKVEEEKLKAPSTTSGYAVGALRGEPALNALLTSLRQTVSALPNTPGVIDSLSEIGVAVPKAVSGAPSTPEGLAGKLVFDEARFDAALASDPDAVEELLRGAGGVADALEAVLEPITKPVTGFLDRSTSSAEREVSRIDARIVDFDRRLSLREERMRAEFTALEIALGNSQAQSAWISSQLATLPTWNTGRDK